MIAESIMEIASVFGRSLVGLILVCAGISKFVFGVSWFTEIIRQYRVLPEVLVRPMAYTVPAAEIAGGAALTLGLSLPLIGWSVACLFTLFSGAIAIELVGGRRELKCGCFGAGHARSLSAIVVLRNIGLSVLAVWSALTGSELNSSFENAFPVMSLSVALMAGWALIGALLSINALEEKSPRDHVEIVAGSRPLPGGTR